MQGALRLVMVMIKLLKKMFVNFHEIFRITNNCTQKLIWIISKLSLNHRKPLSVTVLSRVTDFLKYASSLSKDILRSRSLAEVSGIKPSNFRCWNVRSSEWFVGQKCSSKLKSYHTTRERKKRKIVNLRYFTFSVLFFQ